MAGYIFRCSNETEDECFERMLFGDVKQYDYLLNNIQIGDSLFLFNYKSGRFYGEFEASSKFGNNIEPGAWGGRYPSQVKVVWKREYKPLSIRDVDKVLVKKPKFHGYYYEPVLTDEQTSKLREVFENKHQLSEPEQSFRDQYPAKYRTDDGHFVRSYGELTIDNWLFSQGICHGYERRLPIEENMYCDFYLLDEGKYVYIEFWGLEDAKYQQRKEHKINLYKQNNWPLIELERKDLENLDEIFNKKLVKYFTRRR